MLIRLLRLFSFVRSLELELQKERDKNVTADAWAREARASERRIESELIFWKKKSGEQDSEIMRLHSRIEQTLEREADTMSLHAIGKRIHSKAETPPAGPPQGPPIPTGRMFARDAARQQAMKTRSELETIWKSLPPLPTNGN